VQQPKKPQLLKLLQLKHLLPKKRLQLKKQLNNLKKQFLYKKARLRGLAFFVWSPVKTGCVKLIPVY
jgi:hypothetical protein